MIDNVERADATLTELEVINELPSAVEIGHRLAELTEQHVRETATLLAAVRRHFVKRDSLEFEWPRDVLDNVVGATPVAPRLVETMQVTGRHECTDNVRRVWVRRSFRQQRHLSADERMQLLVASCTHRRTLAG